MKLYQEITHDCEIEPDDGRYEVKFKFTYTPRLVEEDQEKVNIYIKEIKMLNPETDNMEIVSQEDCDIDIEQECSDVAWEWVEDNVEKRYF